MDRDDTAVRAVDDDPVRRRLDQITAVYPEVAIRTARSLTADGQFNDVLIVNEAIVFRFPRSPQVAATLATEAALLQRLHGHLPLPTPDPCYRASDPHNGGLVFMGYAMLPGQPLWRDTFDRIADERILDALAAQLAGFLWTLHTLPLAALGLELPMLDSVDAWDELFTQFQSHLYPAMRADARADVTRGCTALLEDLRRNPPQPALRHGDFGTGNILYDAQRSTVTGIIDFGFAGVGDATLDVAALAASYGEAFVERCAAYYPGITRLLPRARLYQRTFALQQALYALRDGNRADYEDGIEDYV